MVSKIKNIDFLLAFEASRKEARMCRQEFEQVKKRRYDLFSQCFEYVSVAIDQIYKKLCRNNSAQVCIFHPQILVGFCVIGGGFFLGEISTTLFEWPAIGQSRSRRIRCDGPCSRARALCHRPAARAHPKLSSPVSPPKKWMSSHLVSKFSSVLDSVVWY